MCTPHKEVTNEMIKNGGEELKLWLLNIYNACLEIENIPERWKISLMKMLKKDAKSDPNARNYKVLHYYQ